MKLWSNSWANGDRIDERYAAGRLEGASGVGFSDNLNPHLAWRDEPLRVTASAGATWLVPDANSHRDQVHAKADALLYQAKAAGRNQAVMEAYSPGKGAGL